MRRILLSSLLVTVLGAAAPGAASAAALAPLKACYVSVDSATTEPVGIDGSGFVPGHHVDVKVDGVTVNTAEVYPDGTVSGSISAPYQQTGERPFTVTLAEKEDAANTVEASTRVTALSLRLKPRRAKPSARVEFIGSGFTLGSTVYGHYLYAGKLRKTVRFGAPQGPCGHIDVKRRQIPVARPKTGTWTLQADALKRYKEQPGSVFVRLAIKVQRVLAGP